MAQVTRDAFLYLEPKHEKNRASFAQCRRCHMWTSKKHKICMIHGRDEEVEGGDSCGLYVEGDPMPEMAGKAMKLVTPKESGLVRQPVRCENCVSFAPAASTCKLYVTLNRNPHFALKTRVKPQGCCNAQILSKGASAGRRAAMRKQ